MFYFAPAAPASALTADNRVPVARFSQVAGSSIPFGWNMHLLLPPNEDPAYPSLLVHSALESEPFAHPLEGKDMGFDDLVNKAKDLLGQGEAKAQDAAGEAAAGNTEAAAADAGAASGLIGKAKEMLSDDKIDSIAGAIKDKTPDNVDKIVDQVAEKGKQFNG